MTADQTGDLLRALADPPRLRLLALLRAHGILCVCELEQVTGLAQYTVSRNLGILRRAGLVEGRRNGARMDYCLRDDLPPATLALADAAVDAIADDPLIIQQQAAAALLRGCCAS
ncbi:MAG: helix-turn-helix transcriptional regulator [Armatimonadetes bacterium]|nr:helix-turn-helix transcriptional regulator [Armatimonadota bacterium]